MKVGQGGQRFAVVLQGVEQALLAVPLHLLRGDPIVSTHTGHGRVVACIETVDERFFLERAFAAVDGDHVIHDPVGAGTKWLVKVEGVGGDYLGNTIAGDVVLMIVVPKVDDERDTTFDHGSCYSIPSLLHGTGHDISG